MEHVVLSNLIDNEDYGRKVLPYLKNEYFFDPTDKLLFNLINDYVIKYNGFPTKETLYIELSNKTDINENLFEQTKTAIQELHVDQGTKLEWLIDKTEEFCQEKAIHNAVSQVIKILDSKSDLGKGAMPKLLEEALQVSFESSIGHDFLQDAELRWDAYHKQLDRIPFDLHYMNVITNGGFSDKTLNCFLAPTGAGKSLFMCHMAAYNLMCNKNVLYITMEMAEERIAERIDANLLNIPLKELMLLEKDQYTNKINKLNNHTKGRLLIKEYPTATAGSGHFRHLLSELRIKKNFIPDIIYIDYLNLCTSSRIKGMNGVNSYAYIKAIAEELRGLAVEFCLPIVTATQANRDALGSSDIGLDNTSDSIGLPMTVDFMAAIIPTEELDEQNLVMVKQLKNRYGDESVNRRFVIGIDKTRMKLYDAKNEDQADIMGGPVMDNTDFGQADSERSKKFDRSKFKGFQ